MLSRRGFVSTSAAVLGSLAAPRWLVSIGSAQEPKLAEGAPHAEKLGWRLGCQAYSFNRFSFFEAIGKTAQLGLRYIEAYPGQRLTPEGDAKFDESMSADNRREVKSRLADAGVKLVNYGVRGLGNNVDENRAVFEFAKEMGIETIVSEPSLDAFDAIEPLCNEYQINVALHNHPKPSLYWNPDTVLEACKGRGKRLGACADTGHWMRSEIVPLEAIKKLEGRIISFHFKDLNAFGRDAHDVPWGTGKADVPALLREIHRQGLKAVFSIEYEYHWENSLPEIAECVKFFDAVSKQILEG